MDYESMDWEVETTKIVAAFGLQEPCEFFHYANKSRSELRRIHWKSSFERFPNNEDNIRISARYTRSTKQFGFNGYGHIVGTALQLNWDGTVAGKPLRWKFPESIPRAFFYLDLLTPEVEEALNVSISSHQKLEWALKRKPLM